MNEAKFTKGPWHVGRGHELSTGMKGWEYYPVCWSKDDENVCDVVYNKADADLIAAAPEMYEMLKSLLDDCEICSACAHYPGEITPRQQIEAVLKKARGEA